jgi:hypothetical protein
VQESLSRESNPLKMQNGKVLRRKAKDFTDSLIISMPHIGKR